MSTFEVLDTYGAPALARFAGSLVLFLALHLLRCPLLLVVRLLEAAMRRVDAYVSTHACPLTTPTPRKEHPCHG